MTLDTAAYEALYNKRADFAIPFTAWEGIEAEQRGIALRTSSSPTTASRTSTRSSSPATATGWTPTRTRARRSSRRPSAASSSPPPNPEEAADILVAENPGVFDANPELPRRRQRSSPTAGCSSTTERQGGRQTLEQWTGYSSFLFEQGLLVDADGKPLTEAPDYAALFTNDFLP